MATIESFKADISSMSPSSEPKNQFISCNILKNGPKLNSWCVVLSHQLLRVEQHLLFTFKLAKKGVQKPYSLVWCIVYYKISREICTLWLVRTSSLYFHKARTLRHMSAVLRYNAHSLCHQYKRVQFIIHLIKEIKKIVPWALLSYMSTWEFLRSLKKNSHLLI